MKTTIARWLASRAEHTARQIRRDLRDHTRRELTRAARADKRARGLRLYLAWSRKSAPLVREIADLHAATRAAGLNIERTRGVLCDVSLQPFHLQPTR